MNQVAFVSHSDCSRHDTGWNHPEHQGRLPAVMRAVYADMLALHEVMLEVEGRHADEAELRLVHTAEHVERVRGWARDAAERGRPIEVAPGIVVSDASWEAARAAVGCVLTGVDVVLAGKAASAFCAIRPPGAGALPDAPGGFGLFNTVAIAARYLTSTAAASRVLVVEWAGTTGSRIRDVLSEDAAVRVISIGPGAATGAAPAHELERRLQDGSDGATFQAALDSLLAAAAAAEPPDFVLLAAGFDILAGDPLGRLSLAPRDVYAATITIREWADRVCGGRIVSVLEGGYDAAATGRAVVQHLRGLAALDPAT